MPRYREQPGIRESIDEARESLRQFVRENGVALLPSSIHDMVVTAEMYSKMTEKQKQMAMGFVKEVQGWQSAKSATMN